MMEAQVSKKSVNILRVMLSGIFIIAGINHVVFPGSVAKRLMESGFYEHLLFFVNAEILVVTTGIGLLTGGVFFLVNRYTRYAALLLLALLVPITISVQLEGWETSGPLLKNVAIAGGLLFFIMNKFVSTKSNNSYEAKG